MFNLDSEEALTSVGAFFVLKRKAMWLTLKQCELTLKRRGLTLKPRESTLKTRDLTPVSYTHLTLPTTPYV